MRLITTALLIAVCGATPALAQSDRLSPGGRQAVASDSGGPDFLFGRPRAWVTLSGSWLVPRASGQLFTFVSDQLTLSQSDFRAPAFTGTVGVPLTSRLDAVADIEVSNHRVGSQYRHYVKADRSEITQTTAFGQAGVALGLRYLPLGRGKDISKYAFVPRRVTPYVGGGLGFMRYTFQQQGEFVDFVDLSIFNHSFASDGWSVGSHLDAGADVQVWRMFFLSVGARYAWAHAGLSQDFVGFDGIDLAGLKSSTGVTIVF